MLCLLVNAFRDRPMKDVFTDWAKIQLYVNGNVNRFTREVIEMKSKIIENQVQIHLDRFFKIKNEFFSGNNKNLFKNLVTNKNLKIIVAFVYNVVNYVLAPERHADETAPSETCSHTIRDNVSTVEISHPTPRSYLP